MLAKITSVLLAFPLLINLVSPSVSPTYTTTVVGTGTAISCTEAALDQAISQQGTITFNCGPNPVTIPITHQKQLEGVTIVDGGGKITLDANRKDRIFKTAPASNIFLKNMTLTNGYVFNRDTEDDGNNQGGALMVGIWGDIAIDNVTFTNNEAAANQPCMGGGAIWFKGFNYSVIRNSRFIGNKAQNGGAINNLTADLSIDNSTFDSNQAVHAVDLSQPLYCGGGGAIYIDGATPSDQGGSGEIHITNSKFTNNSTNNFGGAVFAYLYSNNLFAVDESIFSSNKAYVYTDKIQPPESGEGGGIWVGGDNQTASSVYTGKVLITNSEITNNHADFLGGGIASWDAHVEITNVTISGNEASNSLGWSNYMKGIGGGLSVGTGSSPVPGYQVQGVKLANVTVADNHAGNAGGGILFMGGTNTNQLSTLANTIVANNTAGLGYLLNCNKNLIDLGGNVQYPAKNAAKTDDSNCTDKILIADPKLASLANNGGTTKTIAIQSGSPAINHGNTVLCPTFDQRGYVRNGICDSGAYEYQGKPFVPTDWIYLPQIRQK